MCDGWDRIWGFRIKHFTGVTGVYLQIAHIDWEGGKKEVCM